MAVLQTNSSEKKSETDTTLKIIGSRINLLKWTHISGV